MYKQKMNDSHAEYTSSTFDDATAQQTTVVFLKLWCAAFRQIIRNTQYYYLFLTANGVSPGGSSTTIGHYM
jgi:hypothetical protein